MRSAQVLNASDAARRLGVSMKALRLYEERGLITPARTAAGWRAYGAREMARAGEIVALRALGLSLAAIARVLDGDAQELEPALAAHQGTLEARAGALAAAIGKVATLRADLKRGKAPAAGALAGVIGTASPSLAFDLPWPWGGERFELSEIRPLTWLIGPLGSGKTRLAMRLAEAIPGGVFLGLDRAEDAGVQARLAADPALAERVERAIAWLVEDGATRSDALTALVVALEDEAPAALVIDMIEGGLDEATQEALSAHLRRRRPDAQPLFAMTRSSAILDLAAVGPNEAILFCPANHSPPTLVAPCPGAPGYEAVATCLATPKVRARTAGLIAMRPQVA